MRAMVACEPHFCPLSWSQRAAPMPQFIKILSKMVKQILETSKIRSVAKLCSGGDLCFCKKLFSNLQDTFQNVENATLS